MKVGNTGIFQKEGDIWFLIYKEKIKIQKYDTYLPA